MTKDKMKLINRITTIIVLIAFIVGVLFKMQSLMIILCLIDIIGIWILYIMLYPNIHLFGAKSEKDFKLPWIGLIVSLIILLLVTYSSNFDNSCYFISIFPIVVILIIPYINKLIKIKSLDSKRFLNVIGSAIFIAFSISIPFNKLFPIVNTSRMKVQVLSKNYASAADSEKTFALYLKVDNTVKKFVVSKKKYYNTKEEDYVLIERRENLLGMIFYEVY